MRYLREGTLQVATQVSTSLSPPLQRAPQAEAAPPKAAVREALCPSALSDGLRWHAPAEDRVVDGLSLQPSSSHSRKVLPEL